MTTPPELRNAIAEGFGALTAMREWVFAEANSLCREFWRVRAELQQEYIRSAPRHIGLHKRLHDAYAPLKLAWRSNKGSLELYWMTISHGRKSDQQTRRGSTIKKQLPRGTTKRDGSYSDRKLKQYARPWELDWIRATELQASHLRHIYLSIRPAQIALRSVDEKLVRYHQVMGRAARDQSLGAAALAPSTSTRIEMLDLQLDPALNHPMVAPAPKRQ
jgi:hypothetical protein